MKHPPTFTSAAAQVTRVYNGETNGSVPLGRHTISRLSRTVQRSVLASCYRYIVVLLIRYGMNPLGEALEEKTE